MVVHFQPINVFGDLQKAVIFIAWQGPLFKMTCFGFNYPPSIYLDTHSLTVDQDF